MKRLYQLQKELFFFCFLCVIFFWVQELKADPLLKDTTLISLPKGTVEGRLDNGLHYLILKNSMPESRIEFRLVMRVGSLQEKEDQKGAAHFLEHVAFGGTKHFPKRSLVEYVESLGMKYGRDINAVTGFDRTIYMFGVPTDRNKEETIDKSLLILRDWLDGMSLDSARVEKEKGVILEELRGYDLDDDFYKLKIGQGRFKGRMPLGEIEDINSMTSQKLRDYYMTWYDPSLATLVIVGDVSPTEIESKIKKKFSSLNKKKSANFISYPLIYNEGIHTHEVLDSLLERTNLELIIPHPSIIIKSISDVVKKEQEKMLIYALNKRMYAREIDADFTDSWYLSDKNHFTISVNDSNRKGLFQKTVNAINELYYITSSGWSTEELNKIKTDFTERINTINDIPPLSSDLCDDFLNYSISGDISVLDQSDKNRIKDLLMQTSSQTLQSVLNEILLHKNKTLLVASRSHNGLGGRISDSDIENIWLTAENKTPDPYIYIYSQKRKKQVTN